MITELKNKFPDWCDDTSSDYSLILSDDIDSLMSCSLQETLFNRKVNYFIDFNQTYLKDGLKKQACQTAYRVEKSDKKIIGIDISLCNKFRCWDNHISLLSSQDEANPNSANLNSVNYITRDSYFDKFSGSTFIQMCGYHSIDISTWTDEMKKVLCCIDSLYESFFVWKIDFRPKQREYLRQLEYWEDLKDILENTPKSEFIDTKNKYNLNGKIKVDEETGLLQTDIKLQELSALFGLDLSLPTQKFYKFKKYDKYAVDLKQKYVLSKDSLLDEDESFFNLALTNKNFLIYSKK